MENLFKSKTKLYVAVNNNGEIVNKNDLKNLGSVFSCADIRIDENGEVAVHIDYNGNENGVFSIMNCTKITAIRLARKYCEKHNITPIKKSWLCQNNYENIYQVIDKNNVEYGFHIVRAYHGDGWARGISGVCITIANETEKQNRFMRITNINDL